MPLEIRGAHFLIRGAQLVRKTLRIGPGLTAKNRRQLRNPTLGNRVWATFTFTFYCFEFVRKVSHESA